MALRSLEPVLGFGWVRRPQLNAIVEHIRRECGHQRTPKRVRLENLDFIRQADVRSVEANVVYAVAVRT